MSFHYTSYKEAKPKGVIRLYKYGICPTIPRLGRVKDADGQIWDIAAIWGNNSVSACKMSQLHPSYIDTSGSLYGGIISQQWDAYTIEWVNHD